MAKKRKQKDIWLLIFLLLILFAIDYPFINNYLENNFKNYELGFVEQVIDGDTLKVNSSSVRLLGINCPERGEEYYNESKSFLEEQTLEKVVKLEKGKQDLDLYGRKLRYVFVDDKNVNLKLVEEGFANFYFPEGKDKYYDLFVDAWDQCLDNNKNLCEKTTNLCGNCIVLQEFDVKNQKITLRNNCNVYCNLQGWSIKDEGRKKFIFPEFILQKEVSILIGNGTNTRETLFWQGESYVWTDTGDTLFLRDNENKLVLWKSY